MQKPAGKQAESCSKETVRLRGEIIRKNAGRGKAEKNRKRPKKTERGRESLSNRGG